MSSAILYLAIVAIWAVVLVPRWLRPRHITSRTLESQLTEPAGHRQRDAGALQRGRLGPENPRRQIEADRGGR